VISAINIAIKYILIWDSTDTIEYYLCHKAFSELLMTEHPEDNLTPKELFDQIGNDPSQWSARAEALLTAAEVLDSQFSQTPKDNFDEFWEFFKLHSISMMLKGMATECLLKAIWISRISHLVTNGKYRQIPGTKRHDLLSLIEAIEAHFDLGLSRDETEILPVLSNAIVIGRYPINTSISKRPSKPSWLKQMKWCKWEIPKDQKIFESLLAKLANYIDLDSQQAGSVEPR
jgi:hypothetical protein